MHPHSSQARQVGLQVIEKRFFFFLKKKEEHEE